jgi:hypothetical protein
MDAGDVVRFVATLLILAAILAAIGGAVMALDLTSYMATDRTTIGPEDAARKALIVYDPGITGTAKKSALWMGNDLATRGYNVTVAGVRSRGAENATEYSPVVLVAPAYAWGLPGTAKDYARSAQINGSAILGIYSIGEFPGVDGSTAGAEASWSEAADPGATCRGYVSAWDPDAEERSYAFIYDLLG